MQIVIAVIIIVVIGLLGWGVKHAVDLFQATAAENATLKVEIAELSTSLRESERTSGIVFQVAKDNRGAQAAVGATVSAAVRDLRAAALLDPGLRDRASRPVPDAVQQRLRKYPTTPDGYPAVQGAGPVPGGDAGTRGKQPDGGKQGRDSRGVAGSAGQLQPR